MKTDLKAKVKTFGLRPKSKAKTQTSEMLGKMHATAHKMHFESLNASCICGPLTEITALPRSLSWIWEMERSGEVNGWKRLGGKRKGMKGCVKGKGRRGKGNGNWQGKGM